MALQLTINFDSFDELQAFCQTEKIKTPVAAKPVAKSAAKKKEAPVVEETKDIEEAIDETVTKEQLADATNNLMEAKGRDITVGVLAQFAAKRARDLAPEQYAEYLKATQEAMAS